MFSWSFIRGILVTVLFLINFQTDHTQLGILALCSIVLLCGVELAGSSRLKTGRQT